MNKNFLLNKLSVDNYYSDPFPHIVINNCLDLDAYNSLVDVFPNKKNFDIDLNENNKRGDIFAKDIYNSKNLDENLQDFFKINNSSNFAKKILEFFSEDFMKIYPHHFNSVDDILESNIGVTHQDNYENNRFLIEMSAAINTPVKKVSAVRQAHLDKSRKIFTALYYMRDEADDTEGGDLILYKWNPEYSLNKKKYLYQESLGENHASKHKVVKYSKNTLVLFLNSIDSLHGVSPRSKTDFFRKFFCITCNSEFQLNNFEPKSNIERIKLNLFNKLRIL